VREEYERQGYCVREGFLPPAEVAALREEIERICEGATLARHDAARLEMEPDQEPGGTKVRRIYEPCTYYERFRRLSDSSRLLDAVEELLGPNLTFHYSKINMKPPTIGSVVDWHQDLSYYPLTNTDSVSILFYLDDADRANGCLQVIPGAHREGMLDHTRDGWFQGRITAPVDESRAVPLEAAAGSVIFMHCTMPHASAPNRSSRARRTLILSYRAADAFPIYLGDMTPRAEAHVRQARGEPAACARCSPGRIPIPRYPRETKSLYELQELSRGGQAGAR